MTRFDDPSPTQGKGPIRSVVINGVSVDIPESKLGNYAVTENGKVASSIKAVISSQFLHPHFC